jgi:hypothetical protein
MKSNLAPAIAAPAVDEWSSFGAAFRAFDGPKWRIAHTIDQERQADIVVSVIGLRYANGDARREIVIDCPDTPIITPAEARKLGTALIAAAAAADG